MRRSVCCPAPAILCLALSACFGLQASAQTGEVRRDDPNIGLFMGHLREHWDDVHDVIMRFHRDDPGLKGVAFITMNWRGGALASASVDSNSTGNPAFGPALIAAMEGWRIRDLSDDWTVTIPIRTAIRGSEDPVFPERGIFTGSVTDEAGRPIAGARLVLAPGERPDARPDTAYANREGIFIRTLILPGNWRVECSRDGYVPAVIDTLTFAPGQHVQRAITLSKR